MTLSIALAALLGPFGWCIMLFFGPAESTESLERQHQIAREEEILRKKQAHPWLYKFSLPQIMGMVVVSYSGVVAIMLLLDWLAMV